MRRQRAIKFICIPMLIGSILWVASFASIHKTRVFLSSAQSTRGTVSGFDCAKRARSCDAEITYRDAQGTAQRFVETNEDPSPWFQTGTQVKVLYQPSGKYGQPEGKLNQFTTLWGWSILFAATGTPFLALGGVLLRDAMKASSKRFQSKP